MSSLFQGAAGFFWWGPDSECSGAEDEFDAAERFDGSGPGGQVRGRGLDPAAAAALDSVNPAYSSFAPVVSVGLVDETR